MRDLSTAALFAAALALGALCHPAGADLSVHAQLCVALLGFLAAGSALERLLGLSAGFLFQRIALGQLLLFAWFYLRSLPCALGLPGLGRAELWCTLAALCLFTFATLRKRKAPPAEEEGSRWSALGAGAVLLAWAAALHWFLGRYSGHLETPSSDPDLHAFLARLTLTAGHVVTTQAPYTSDFVTYPSGFSALNALWMLLGGASPVAIVNAQPALQALLALGLLVEAGSAVRPRPRAAPALFLLGLGALLVGLPVHPDAAALEGTARLAGPALLVLPLAFALRLRSRAALEGERRGLVLLVAGASVLCSFALNPALLLALPPALLAALLISPRALLAPLRAYLALALLALLLVGSDAWVREQWRERRAAATLGQQAIWDPARPPAAPLSSAAPAAAPSSGGLLRGLRAAADDSALWVLPRGCVASAQCRGELLPLRDWTPLLFLLALLALALRKRAWLPAAALPPARLLLALAAALWLTRVIAGALADPGSGGTLMQSLLHRYAQQGLGSGSVLLWLLALDAGLALAAALLEPPLLARGVRLGADALATAVAAALVALLLGQGPVEELPAALAANLGTPAPSGLGAIEPVDLEFVRAAAGLVPPGERVLLPGLPAFSGFEPWIYALGTSRAVPLYSSLDFAFFLGMGSREFEAPQYRRRVCRALDLSWLAARGVRWMVLSPLLARDACIHGLDRALERDFTEALRVGDRILFKLRDDRLGEAAIDPLLGVPLAEPRKGTRGAGVRGALALAGPVAVSGWACDPGSDGPSSVELELTDEASGRTVHELHPAALESPQGAECPGPHGFAFAPVAAPAGRYRARLFAWDGAGAARIPLGEPFPLQLDF